VNIFKIRRIGVSITLQALTQPLYYSLDDPNRDKDTPYIHIFRKEVLEKGSSKKDFLDKRSSWLCRFQIHIFKKIIILFTIFNLFLSSHISNS
jgi:hypothetical protein